MKNTALPSLLSSVTTARDELCPEVKEITMSSLALPRDLLK